jgi:hypothetical protein
VGAKEAALEGLITSVDSCWLSNKKEDGEKGEGEGGAMALPDVLLQSVVQCALALGGWARPDVPSTLQLRYVCRS